jgi:hypothetical protein
VSDALINGVRRHDHIGPRTLLDLCLRKHFAGSRGKQLEDLHVLRIDLDEVFAAGDAIQ